jgi:uncharacterized protein (UPF0276 family)
MNVTPPSDLGFGLGLRAEYYSLIQQSRPKVDWFEIITEDYLIPGGRPLDNLYKIREHYPIIMHGVSLSIGSTDPLDMAYVQQVKQLATDLEVPWLSDHLCWTGIHHQTSHDLLPIPYTSEALKHVVGRIQQVQDVLGRQLVLENVSSYLTYKESVMTEWEFLIEVVQAADCKILLDVNNIFVSGYNHHFEPETYLNAIPIDRVQQIHIAGHTNLGDMIIDTHDHAVIPPVWQLYQKALQRFGMVSTLLERDDRFPPLPMLLNELQKTRQMAAKALNL